MPQSLARVNIHLVFSTKNRTRSLPDDIRGSMHRYIASILEDRGCHAILMNSVEDHIHILFELSRTIEISKIVQDIKTTSSKWTKAQRPGLESFAWQSGYAAFSVDSRGYVEVREYIANQRQHHLVESFQDEYRRFLTENGVEFDERYVWD